MTIDKGFCAICTFECSCCATSVDNWDACAIADGTTASSGGATLAGEHEHGDNGASISNFGFVTLATVSFVVMTVVLPSARDPEGSAEVVIDFFGTTIFKVS